MRMHKCVPLGPHPPSSVRVDGFLAKAEVEHPCQVALPEVVVRQGERKKPREVRRHVARGHQVDVVQPTILHDPERPHPRDEPRAAIPVAEHVELEKALQEHRDVADEEVADDALLLLEEHGACVEVCLHYPEGLLDPPEVVVRGIDLRGRHVGLRGDEHVVAGEKAGLVDRGPVHLGDHLVVGRAALARGPECHELRALPVLALLCLGKAQPLRLRDEPVQFEDLLLPELRVERDDPFLGDGEASLPGRPAVPVVLVGEPVGALLQPVDHLAAAIHDVLPAVFQQHPCPLRIGKALDGLGEQVAVALECRLVDVPRAVQPLVRDHDGPGAYVVPFPHPLDRAADLGLLGLVPREKVHVDGDEARVEQEPHADERRLLVLLRGAVLLEIAFPVYLEIEVGAVEIGHPRVQREPLRRCPREDLDDLVVLAPHVLACREDLVIGVRPPIAVEDGEHVVECPALRARGDGAAVGKGREDLEQAEPEAPHALQQVEVPLHVQLGHHAGKEEMPHEPRGVLGYLPHPLRRPRVLARLVHPLHLRGEVGDRVVDPPLSEILNVPDLPYRAVRGDVALLVVVALVHLQVQPLVGLGLHSGLLEEKGHSRPPEFLAL